MKCTLCQGTKYKTLYIFDKQQIAECQKCGLVRTTGEQSVDYKNYHRDEVYDEFSQYFRNIFKKRFDTLTKHKKNPGKILDIGAATGNLLALFQDRGWEAWGIEPSNSAKIAQKKNLKILQSNFEVAKLPKIHFDIVVMNHTLEHVEDPVAVLTKIYSILKMGGLVYIDVPNFGSLSSELAGRGWKYLLPNEHVHHFTPDSLQKCIRKSGFSIVSCRTWSGIFDVANPALKFWQTLSGGKKQFFTDLIELPGNIVATVLNRGTSLAVIGKKL